MAGFRSTFEANVDYAYGRGARDLTGQLERGIAGLGGSGSAVRDLARQAGAARSQIKDLNREIASLKEQQASALSDQSWLRLNANIKEAQKSVRDLRMELRQMPFQALERGLGRVTKGLVAFNSALLALSLEFVIDSMKRVYELQERWTRAVGAFNMRIGGTTAGLRGATKAATAWSSTIRGLTNGGIEEGIEAFGEFTEAIGRTVEQGDQFARFGLQLARGFNLGGSGAGQLTKVLQNIGDTGDDAAETMGALVKGANTARIPTNLLAKDVMEASTYLARFGKEGQRTFVQGAAWARKYTITISQLKGAVEGLDMFDEAAKTASRLNVAFGTMINSMDLMLEDDPAKRLEMIRQQFLAQGTTFDRLTPKQRRYLSETLKLTEDQTAALLSSQHANESYAEFQAKAARREKDELDGKRLMEKQLRATAQTMYAFGAAFDRVTVAIANSIQPVLKVIGLAGRGEKGFRSFGEVMESVTRTVEDFFNSLARNRKWQSFMEQLAVDLRRAGAALRDFVESGGAAKLIGDMADGIKRFYVTVRDVVTFAIPKFRTLIDVLMELSKHMGAIAVSWLALRGFNALGGINMLAGKGVGGSALSALGRGSVLRGVGRVGGAAALGAAGAALGGTGAGIGAGLGSLVGGAFGPAGMLLGGVAGGLLGKLIEHIVDVTTRKPRSEVERAHDDLDAAMKAETRRREEFTGVLEAVQAHEEAADRQRRASNDLLVSMQQAAAKSQGHLVTLNQQEADMLRERADELGMFGRSARDVRRILEGLGVGGRLTKEQLDTLLAGSSAYEAELDKLRDATKRAADVEMDRLQVSSLSRQKEALELTTKLRQEELKVAKQQLEEAGGAVERGASRLDRLPAGASAEGILRAAALPGSMLNAMGGITADERKRLELEAKIDRLDLQNTKDQKRLIGLQTDFLRQQTVIELRRAVMSDAGFLSFQRGQEEVGKSLDQQLVDFVKSGRSILGNDPYALGLIAEGTNLQGLASATRAESTASPIPSPYAPVQVPPELNLLNPSPAPQASYATQQNINLTVNLDGQRVGRALVRNAVTGRH